MIDLIDRQAAIDAIQQHRENVLGGYEYDEGVAFVYAAAHNHIIDVIEQLPSAPPEIIRCKNCKYYTPVTARCEVRGKGLYLIRNMEDFCSRAEPYKGEQE